MLFAVLLIAASAVVLPLLACTLLYLISLIRARYYDKLAHIPGPTGVSPIFGDLLVWVEKNGRCYDRYQQRHAKYGRVRRMPSAFGSSRLEVADPEIFKRILCTNSKNYIRGKLVGSDLFKVIVGQHSLLVTSGNPHHRLRKIASPAFQPSVLREMLRIMLKCNARLNDRLRKACIANDNLAVVPIKEYLSHFTLDVIGLSVFGYEFGASLPERSADANDYVGALDSITRPEMFLATIFPGYEALVKALLWLPSSYLGHSRNAHLLRCVQSVMKMRAQIPEIVAASGDKSAASDEHLLRCIQNGALDKEELKDMVMSIVLAGHETSSVTLSWLLLLLSEHPSWQQRCREEILAKFSALSELTWEGLHELPVLMACVNESMRLYTPVPCGNRMNVDADVLGGYAIPPRTDILLLTAAMHRDPEIWQWPDEFRPERFLEDADDVPWDAFLPFGDGLYKCLGYKFATAEILATAVCLLRCFEFERAVGPSYCEKANVTMVPYPDLELCVKLHA